MFAPILSFIVNLATFLTLFLISIGNLATSTFFTTFHLLEITFTSGQGPKGGELNVDYQTVTFGLWNYCYGSGGTTSACSTPQIKYGLGFLPKLNDIDQMFVPEVVRSFGKATVIFIPACILLMVVVLTVNGARKIQFDLHMVPEVHAYLGPATWMCLAIVPLTMLGSLVGAFAVCCPNRFKSKKTVKDLPPDTKDKEKV
ncbi:hypothetical protein BGZ70_007037 [Mortierella alpina]|uniref:Uncharacterized protein n=1 Tax=Mortierella alpina TaxID=64518 RepID=A0A9P6J7M5_MORAP|nr:hypothetical protein BGZ70_007037 [Mortierella alpina]